MLKRKEIRYLWFAWIYIIEASTFFIVFNVIDNIAQVAFLLCMLVMLILNRLERIKLDKMFYLYLLLIAVTLIPDIVSLNVTGIKMACSYFLPLIMFVFIINLYKGKDYVDKRIFILPLIYGFAISVSGIIIEILNCTGNLAGTQPVFIEKTGTMQTMEIYGLGSYA